MKEPLDPQKMQAVTGGKINPFFTEFLKPHKPSDWMTTMAVGEEDDNMISQPIGRPKPPYFRPLPFPLLPKPRT